MEEPPKKKHRAPQSGAKALKKSKLETKAQNPKGFSIQHTTKAARKVRKTLDRETKKYHLSSVNAKTPVDFDPPLIVGIVGPPRSGKSTLLRSLIQHFGRKYCPIITGPITAVVGKKYRMTFIECDCNINSMIDIAKVADLILLTVNVKKGLEMYHFEFINMLQVHGMPRVIPVLNHLDEFKESSSSRAIRKKIKQRLWTDLSAKIFLLSRFMKKKFYQRRKQSDDNEIDGEYMQAEIQRLARLMVVKVPRPSDWRTGHPYMVVDRLEDVTNPEILNEDEKHSRTISLYGYVRGAPIEATFSNPSVHIPGLGDFLVSECTRQEDPCPAPAQSMMMSESKEEALEAKLKKRLSEGERRLYAPMSKIGGVLFDRDATYIDIGGSHHLGGGRLTSGREKIVSAGEADLAKARELLSAEGHGLDERLAHDHHVQMLADAPFLPPNDLDTIEETSNSEDSDSESDSEDKNESVRMFEDAALPNSDEEPMDFDENDEEGSSSDTDLEELMKLKTKSEFDRRHQDLKNAFDNLDWQETSSGRKNWKRLIYSTVNETPTVDSATASDTLMADMFRVSTIIDEKSTQVEADDVTLPRNPTVSINWSSAAHLRHLIKDCFSTGEYNATEDAKTLLNADEEAQRTLAALKAQKIAKAAGSHVQYKPQEKQDQGENEDEISEYDEMSDSEDDSFNEDELLDGEREEKNDDSTEGFEKSLLRPTKREKILEKRRRHKELFEKLYEAAQRGSGTKDGESATAHYDRALAKKEAQEQLNREVLRQLPPGVREKVEGISPGSYVRLQIAGVPYQFMANFDPRQPLIVGGIVKGEEAKAFIHARFQAHRWLKRVLKSNDPITVSVGWRRYQTIGVFSKEEHNFRKRYLKYALGHEYCHMTFYGPVVAAKTGVIAFVNSTWRNQTDNFASPRFRIAGTGSVTDCNESFQIMKKLKLVGHPYKIFSKTAFIRGMFNSELEAAKMIGCKIQTVSKIRGLIKNALTGDKYKPGDFRATFEATVRKADIVFLRSFVPIELNAFYNPIPNRLLPVAGTAASQDPENKWKMMRTMGELRWDNGIKAEVPEDSKYKTPERVPFVPMPLTIPTKLVAALPFKDKPKPTKKQLRTQKFREDEVRRARIADIPGTVHPRGAIAEESDVPDPIGHQKDRAHLLQRLREIHTAYLQKEHGKMVARTTKYKEKKAEAARQAEQRNKQRRKQFFARRGNMNSH
ncbi:unnamed protein product [Rodentolepis nana]|uniref:Bms1-type G domain-containing protein n=1 Tax=Rodentolepis nana TaxID=102285 RepID=A0A0R3T002_RODNA|nr:unnamed protein product [Rodentolepis nana]